VTALIFALGLLPGALALRQRQTMSGWRRDFSQRVDLVLLAYVLGYMVLHVIVTFQTWDRYLLPILPLVTILAARGVLAAQRWLVLGRKRATAQIPLTIGAVALVAWGSWLGVSGKLPVGSDHGAFDNLGEVVAFVRERPPDARIYQHSLGWYFDFYLFDAPQERPWWENSLKLADLASQAARTSTAREQWLVLTGSEDPVEEGIPAALAGWGLTLREEQAIYRRDQTLAFTVYRIISAGERAAQ
jgi:hypothetical protein